MLDKQSVQFFKSQSWWFDETTQDYQKALSSYGIELQSSIAQFYLHVEDGPTFKSRHIELLHLPWFIINSDYSLLLSSAQSSFPVGDNCIPITNLEAQSCYFYDLKSHRVLLFSASNEKPNQPERIWFSWNEFIHWYFNI
ncbi:hypothetical protein INR79_20550 [Vibrio sp. SCSIO 43132]|uniref:hypothetical protein n=1 Tax=Vibrio sp. SCSIO 43132 TaxID=2779363 RepID=UPI001CAA3CA1|nr:hypothetical protein [Vibrio sp. SCSIO 43132]UAB73553.1 hypothetical protein INR79_20550 [Vibrio sp. SCSIO 43132]